MPQVTLKLRGVNAKVQYGQKGMDFEVVTDVLFNVDLPSSVAVVNEDGTVTVTLQGLKFIGKAAETALYLDGGQ